MANTNYTTPEERRQLSTEEAARLEDLRFRCWTDKPFSSREYKELSQLERKLK